MSIQKKSLLSSLNTTKKAIVASSTTPAQANPSVSAPISARIRPLVRGKVRPLVRGKVRPLVRGKVRPLVRGN
jgi:hypothetical protein